MVKLIGTNGQNANEITNEVVINKLKEWAKLMSYRLKMVEFDKIVADILIMPIDMEKFAKEIYNFAPEGVYDFVPDQEHGANSFEALAAEIKKGQAFWLWWD
ncbi:MAG: DUF4253 domain-containing protein [bacterium]|nr:DUF4253 domain-containing protein [bacterium]